MGAARCRCARGGAAVMLALTISTSAQAQQTSADPATAKAKIAVDLMGFVAGGLLGLGLHESGHLVFDELFDAQPDLKGVHFRPIPFFAIAHRGNLTPRREFIVSSAGFWMQEGTGEWLLTRRPDLRGERAWLTKGVLAFNVLNSIGYALVAFARAGPAERDTRGMAAAIHVNEPVIGALVLTPALLDSYRCFNRGPRWAAWTSRAAKTGRALLVIKP